MIRTNSASSTLPLRPGAVLLGALLALMVLAAEPAKAVFNPVSGGTTTLTVSDGLTKKLFRKGGKLKGISPTSKQGSVFTFEVDSGSLNLKTDAGTIINLGGLKVRANGHRLKLRNPVLKLGRDAALKVSVGKKKNNTLTLFTLSGGSPSTATFGAEVKNLNATLTPEAAKKLNRTLKQKLFKGGKAAGTLTTVPQLATIFVAGGNTDLAASTTFLTKLNTAPPFGPMGAAPIVPATVVSATPPTFRFPITNGTLAPDLSIGTINHQGGIKLTRPHPVPAIMNSVSVENLRVNLSTSSNVEAVATTVVFTRPTTTISRIIAGIDLSGATFGFDPATNEITITGVQVLLDEATANTLNAVFGPPFFPASPGFAAGDPLGTATLTTTVQ